MNAALIVARIVLLQALGYQFIHRLRVHTDGESKKQWNNKAFHGAENAAKIGLLHEMIIFDNKPMNSAQRKELKNKMEAAVVSVEHTIVDLKELTKPIAPENAIGRVSRMDAINNKSVQTH